MYLKCIFIDFIIYNEGEIHIYIVAIRGAIRGAFLILNFFFAITKFHEFGCINSRYAIQDIIHIFQSLGIR